VEFLDDGFRKTVFGVVNDVVNTAEVVGGLHNVVHIDAVFRYANRVGFENVSGLLMGEPAALDVVGVLGQVNLSAVVRGGLMATFPWRLIDCLLTLYYMSLCVSGHIGNTR